MKLILEQWRQYITEDWRDTSWTGPDGEKITIGQIDNYLGDRTVTLHALKLSRELPSLPIQGKERVDAANLEYPIIVVKSEGRYKYVLDGNHRLQKAIEANQEDIRAKVLDLDKPKTPDIFKRMFGGAK
jgi:hypothetical protein